MKEDLYQIQADAEDGRHELHLRWADNAEFVLLEMAISKRIKDLNLENTMLGRMLKAIN